MHWKPKRIIESWLDEAVRHGRMYVSPSECMELLKGLDVEEKDVWNYFMTLAKDQQLLFKATLICHHDNPSIEPTILKEYVHIIKDGQLAIDFSNEFGKKMTCSICQKETEVKLENLIALYSPTEEYINILQEESKNPRTRLKLH